MSDTPETLADIVARMRSARNAESDMTLVPTEWLTQWADRIEAAAEREIRAERTEAIDEALAHAEEVRAEKCRNCTARAPGNVAAMREALEWAAQFVELGVDDDLGADGQNLTTAAEMARDALAAPARNCDRFADCNSAWRDYNAIADRERLPGFDFWLFAEAEGGDHA